MLLIEDKKRKRFNKLTEKKYEEKIFYTYGGLLLGYSLILMSIIKYTFLYLSIFVVSSLLYGFYKLYKKFNAYKRLYEFHKISFFMKAIIILRNGLNLSFTPSALGAYFGVILFIILNQFTQIVDMHDETYNTYVQIYLFGFVASMPPGIIYAFRNLIGNIVAILIALLIVIFLIPKEMSPTYYWLARHHIANYSDYEFVFNQQQCDSFQDYHVPLTLLKNNNCKIKHAYTVIRTTEHNHIIKIHEHKLHTKIFHIPKKSVVRVVEVQQSLPTVKLLNEVAYNFSRLYHKNLMLLVSNKKGQVIGSHGINSDQTYTFKIYKTKPLVLASDIAKNNNLFSFSDPSSTIDESLSGSALFQLSTDRKNKFFRKMHYWLIDKNSTYSSDLTISDLVKTFKLMVSDKYLKEIFLDLQYLSKFNFENEPVIQMRVDTDKVSSLFLYFETQKLIINISSTDSIKHLSIEKPPLNHLVNSIMSL